MAFETLLRYHDRPSDTPEFRVQQVCGKVSAGRCRREGVGGKVSAGRCRREGVGGKVVIFERMLYFCDA